VITNFNSGLQHVHKHIQPEGWGVLHHQLGRIQYCRGSFDLRGEVYIEQALTNYCSACNTLKDFPKSYLALIQDLIKAYLWFGNLDQANQWRDTGLAVFRDLMNAQSTDHQRRHLEAQFSGISRIDVEILIQNGQLTTALETAERYKNRCLTHIFGQWQENTLSPTYDQIRTLLSPTTALIYWHLSDDALTTFLLTPNAQSPHLLDANHLDQCSRAQSLKTWLTDWNTDYIDYRSSSKEKKIPNPKHLWRSQLPNRLTQLKELLGLDTLISGLPKSGITHLILIPHCDLHCLPLAACLPQFVCTTLPSAQVGIALQQRQINHQSGRAQVALLSVEDPKTHQHQMPYAQLESALLCELFPNHTRLAQTQATADAFVKALDDLRHTLIHFTGHAGYNARHPEDSALILSNNQLLTAQTISHLNFDAYPLVFLSACETALAGSPNINTEYVGLASAFLQAGAGHVISTLWNVNEISNAWLVLHFYQLLQQDIAPASALKQAQTWLKTLSYQGLLSWLGDWLEDLPANHHYYQDLQDEMTLIQEKQDAGKIELQDLPYADPYHWAAFTITGDNFP